MSNNCNVSPDAFHKNLFSDHYAQTSKWLTYYNTVLFTDLDMCKVLENEGYIQMYFRPSQRQTGNVRMNIVPKMHTQSQVVHLCDS
jgi:hypothetical protein